MTHYTPTSNELQKNIEVISAMEAMASEAVDSYLVEAETAWQPSDFLPEMSSPDAIKEIRELQERASGLPPEVITSLVGNMITEEALPTYTTYFNLIKGVNDEGNIASDKGWVKWSRRWTAEENRHGDLLNKYLYLSGRADMKQVEITIHNLLANGFDPRTEGDPYQAFIYTSFQERATKISHVNTGKLADKDGDAVLSRICKTIAGDEARHEKAYKTFMAKIFEIDPNGALLAFEKMMKKQIAMPAIMMDTAPVDNLFTRFSAITQKMGIYTTFDYAAIIKHLTQLWKVETLTGLTDYAAKAQDYLSDLAERYRKIAERMKEPETVKLAWLVS
ncbi:acyl-ACP desaturase [Flavisolibacter ginsenosidimutans]|uniref:Acyl-ACP desaturase n=1 Tax=Flavisolibacter ginsenosidimutans TaxID=661481 RepID=A0A5B8UGM9_9BACT|nr:acyl-ACP desaturase [Flavisolibacter ginsenosidimutans]QEC55260.1 acyl-ACP desaturase [Flavisolibacter ginsenosidimutans]